MPGLDLPPLETHYAPGLVECPDCNVTGEMTYNQGTDSFYCCSCGTGFEPDELPETVEGVARDE